MSPPWIGSTKTISKLDGRSTLAPAGLRYPSFKIPTTPKLMSFGPGRLFTSVARCNSLASAPSSLLISQEFAAKSALEHFVDEQGSLFALDDIVNDLGDAKFVTIAHDIGVGIANLLMNDLGYGWIANGKEWIGEKGKKPDYIYDNGLSSELVVMEAKGAIGKSVSRSSLQARVLKAYENQVEPWLGKTITPGYIAHGYAVGTLAKAGASDAEMTIHQAQWPASATPSITASANSSPSSAVALSNYENVFRLMGATNLAAALSDLKRGRRFGDFGEDEYFREVEHLGRRFLIKVGPRPRRALLFGGQWSTFAIDLKVALSFLEQLDSVQTIDRRIELPSIPSDEINRFREFPLEALFEDGLALVPLSFQGQKWIWSTRYGLKQG